MLRTRNIKINKTIASALKDLIVKEKNGHINDCSTVR